MTKSKLFKLVASLGCSIEEDSFDYGFTVDAPQGKVFSANQCHSYVSLLPADEDNKAARVELREDLAKSLSLGLVDCDDVDCEYCSLHLTTK